MGRVSFTSRVVKWTEDKAKKADVTVLELATDIHRVAGMIAPKATRALANSGRIKRNGPANYSVIFGGGAVPYARIRHYINKKTPSSLRYLERAGDTSARNVKRYLDKI